jgi:hypothetical protein
MKLQEIVKISNLCKVENMKLRLKLLEGEAKMNIKSTEVTINSHIAQHTKTEKILGSWSLSVPEIR